MLTVPGTWKSWPLSLSMHGRIGGEITGCASFSCMTHAPSMQELFTGHITTLLAGAPKRQKYFLTEEPSLHASLYITEPMDIEPEKERFAFALLPLQTGGAVFVWLEMFAFVVGAWYCAQPVNRMKKSMTGTHSIAALGKSRVLMALFRRRWVYII
jgi:hypothetical protein